MDLWIGTKWKSVQENPCCRRRTDTGPCLLVMQLVNFVQMTKILSIILIFNVMTFSTGQTNQLRPSDFRRLSRMGREYSTRGAKPLEPTCEELKAMWKFFRRQGKAAEITNELPTFKDPFAYNIWQKYPKIRNTPVAPQQTGRPRSKPVYGRVVHTAPSDHPRVLNPDPPKYYGVVRYFEPDEAEETRRNFGLAATFGKPNRRQKGSFDRLKELVWADRMKELHGQQVAQPSQPPPVLPVATGQSSAPAPSKALAPISAPGSASAPVPTPPPQLSPTPMKDLPIRVSRPYDSAFQGKENSDNIHPYNQDRTSRLKIITDYFNRHNPKNDGNDDNDDNDDNENNEEPLNENPVYGRPYRLRQMSTDDAPNFEY